MHNKSIMERGEKMKTWQQLAECLLDQGSVSRRVASGTTYWSFRQIGDKVSVSCEGAYSSKQEEYTFEEFANALRSGSHWGAWQGQKWAMEAGFYPQLCGGANPQ